MKKIRISEELESLKVYCPDCPMPHNLSSVDVGKILDLIVERDSYVLGETKVYKDAYQKGYNGIYEPLVKQIKEIKRKVSKSL